MKIFRSLAEIPANFGPSVLTVGNFDGVHCGHRAVLAEVIASARGNRAASVAVTFTPHPTQVVRPESAPKLLTPDAVKLELLAATGVDAVLLLNFDETLRHTSAEDFVRGVLCDGLQVIEAHEGDNFHFGYRGQGSVGGLQELGKRFGFRTVVSPPLLFRGAPISSSRVRECVTGGRLREARHLLGRSFSVRGGVAKGRGYGTRWTVPTINLAPYDGVLPANGVYVTELTVRNPSAPAICFHSVTNIGTRPTFGEDSFAVESHILNFEPLDLSEETEVEVTFHLRLRSEQKFDSPETLKAQIQRDVKRARRWFGLRAALQRALKKVTSE
jgi:riboflavin kinase/FMN adenylyltransferase